MLRSNSIRSTTVILAALFATVMIMGPSISNVGDVFAQKYKNWDDCRDDHSKNWCKKYFKHHDNDVIIMTETEHHKVLDNHNHQSKTVK